MVIAAITTTTVVIESFINRVGDFPGDKLLYNRDIIHSACLHQLGTASIGFASIDAIRTRLTEHGFRRPSMQRLCHSDRLTQSTLKLYNNDRYVASQSAR
uniref:Uncharacterized protein n=1 Tax=Schizaphis graminum TaxID=13262 RepID=A0A2S2P6V3_SCHGA